MKVAKLDKDRKAVSPVVGVILMVAATIVIAAIVMGYLGTFTPPKKTLDIMATNVQIYEDDNGHWLLSATLTGADVDQINVDNVNHTTNDLRVTIINIDNNEQGSTNTVEIHGDVISVDITTDLNINITDNDKIHVVIKYLPTGQPLFDGIVIARE